MPAQTDLDDATGAEATLDAPAEQSRDEGRIGYGRFAKYTPLGLALLIILALGVVGYVRQGGEADPLPAATLALVGAPAPDLLLETFDGRTVHLADLRGTVVVLNFWASWCDPCKREAPLLEQLAQEGATGRRNVAVLGVGLKNDKREDEEAFVRTYGLTYAIGQDGGGTHPTRGLIEIAYGIAPLYPTTLFIDRDGVVAAAKVGELDAATLLTYVALAERGAEAAADPWRQV